MRYLVCMVVAAIALPAAARAPAANYAQQLIDAAMARHPGVLALTLYAAPPKTTASLVVASTSTPTGQPAGAAELAVITSCQPIQNISADRKRINTTIALKDVSGDTVGALDVALPFAAGTDRALALKQTEQLRDELRRHVINAANLMDPVPYVPGFQPSPYAQHLVDSTMARHPELLVLALHVAAPDGDYPIIASSIGRIGKAADGDDRRVITTGEPIVGAYGANKTRFGIELPMREGSGAIIGALSVGYAYKPGDDDAALLRQAIQVEAELRAQIPSLAVLRGPPL